MKLFVTSILSLVAASSAFAFEGTKNIDLVSNEVQIVIAQDPMLSTSAPTLTLGIATFWDSYLGNRVIRDAQEGAAVYIATGGEIRDVRFDTAVRMIRTSISEDQASDMKLAEDITVLTSQSR